jgi:hypothetical protein
MGTPWDVIAPAVVSVITVLDFANAFLDTSVTVAKRKPPLTKSDSDYEVYIAVMLSLLLVWKGAV